jgi:C4-dicarboxylate-specific signal transduction histidine kinase
VAAALRALPDLIVRVRDDGAIEPLHPGEVLPTFADVVVHHAIEALAAGEPRRFEHREGGSAARDWEVRVVPAARDAAVCVLRDVTEQRRIQARLLLTDRMASIGALSAGIAHEINNPLASVLANAVVARELVDEIRSRNQEEVVKELAETLDDVTEGARRVERIVRDLRVFASGEDERVARIDLRRVLESSLAVVGHGVQQRARLVIDVPDEPLLILANETRIAQVFVNLLANAADALVEATAAENEVRVTMRKGRGHVVIEVTDNGPGIPAAVRERLFTPFFTTKAIGVGTGLGLSICHTIVTRYGGEITAESEEGRGATFRVTLPLDQSDSR